MHKRRIARIINEIRRIYASDHSREAPHEHSWITYCFYFTFMNARGRNMDEHGWKNRGSPLYSISYMDDANCFPKFAPLFLAGRFILTIISNKRHRIIAGKPRTE